jgi:DNA-binding MarR family transcriptional regulator
MTIINMSKEDKRPLREQSASPAPTGPVMTLKGEVPPVRRVPIALARRFFQICNAVAAQSFEETQLVPLEFAVMAYINGDVGEPGIDQASLAARMGIDRNSTSLLVAGLQAKGLLETRVNAEDRRSRSLWLTRRGERLYLRLQPISYADQLGILNPLKPSEREVFLDLLVRVIEGNRALARPGAARRKRGSSSIASSP